MAHKHDYGICETKSFEGNSLFVQLIKSTVVNTEFVFNNLKIYADEKFF